MTDSEVERLRAALRRADKQRDDEITALVDRALTAEAKVEQVWAEAVHAQQLADNAHDFDLRQAWDERDSAVQVAAEEAVSRVHWRGRAERAEAEVERLRKALRQGAHNIRLTAERTGDYTPDGLRIRLRDNAHEIEQSATWTVTDEETTK